jgi:L-fuconolactonase
MNILDSHVHFWDPNHLRYAWLDGLPALNRAYLPDHVPVRVGDSKVEGIVFVQADCAPSQGLAEVEWVARLAVDDARVRGIVAFAPLEQGTGAREGLVKLARQPMVKGVRRLIQDERAGFAAQPDFIAGVRALAEFQFSFDICIRHYQLPEAIELARQCPNVQFVLDHLGKPDIKHGELEPWRAQIKTLAALENVFCKISGLVTEADWQNWQPAALQPYVDAVLDAFGINRVMFGSDAPVLYLASTYEGWVTTLRALTDKLRADERQKLWRDTARAFYRL